MNKTVHVGIWESTININFIPMQFRNLKICDEIICQARHENLLDGSKFSFLALFRYNIFHCKSFL